MYDRTPKLGARVFRRSIMKNLHQPNDIVARRYRIVTPLGRGSMGTTYEAEDLSNYKRVAIKVVSLHHVRDWKVLELFDREAKVLANLDHPAIPKYLDRFYEDTPDGKPDSKGDRRFYLVQELACGQSLATLVEKGWHPTQLEVKRIACQILEIFQYLHNLSPAVIHRDIKPENIIRREDGTVYLVDFGAVQDVYRNTLTRGGTFVGTLGYMPPEQFSGSVEPASDLYALGATLLFVLTGRSPVDFPQKRLKIEFRDSEGNLAADLADWLEKALEPAIEDRFSSAKIALAALQERSDIAPEVIKRTAALRVSQTPDRLTVAFQPLQNGLLLFFQIVWVLFFFFSLIFLLCYFNETPDFQLPLLVIFCLLVFVVFILIIGMSWRCEVRIDAQKFGINWSLWGLTYRRISGKTADIAKVEHCIRKSYHSKSRIVTYHYSCKIWEGIYPHSLDFNLSQHNNKWLVNKISCFLQKINHIL